MTAGSSFQQNTVVIIKGGSKGSADKLEGWRYWEIVGEVTWRGANRYQATDAAKWCMRATPGSETRIPLAGLPDILLKVKEKK